MYSKEWLEYTVDVNSIGLFSLEISYAADSADQTISLLVNNRTVMDQLQLPVTGTKNDWTTLTLDVTLNAGVQVFKILADYATGGLHIDKMVITEKEIVQPGTGEGLYRTLFNGKAGGRGWFTDSLCSELDSVVDHEWTADESPGCEANATFWNARWQGYLESLFTEEYTLHLTINDKGRVWLGGEMLIDAWDGNVSNQTHSANILLNSGEKVPVTIEYANTTGNGTIKLEWESRTLQREVIPQSQLYPKYNHTSLDVLKEFGTPLIYPNPASQQVYMETPENSIVGVYVLSGQKIYFQECRSGRLSIDVSGWQKGIYIVKINHSTGIYQGKLIIQ